MPSGFFLPACLAGGRVTVLQESLGATSPARNLCSCGDLCPGPCLGLQAHSAHLASRLYSVVLPTQILCLLRLHPQSTAGPGVQQAASVLGATV